MRIVTFNSPESFVACDQEEHTSHRAKLKTRNVLEESRVLPVRFWWRFSGQEMCEYKGGGSGESTSGESWLFG